MSMLDSLRSKLGIDPDADSYVDDTEENVFPGGQGAAAAQEYTQQQEIKQHSNKVVNINATTQLQVVLVKPERFDDASSIADQLNAKHTVVLNLESASKEVSRRLIDFLSGVAYANNGQIKRVATSTFIITPYNVDIMGDLLDELEEIYVFDSFIRVDSSVEWAQDNSAPVVEYKKSSRSAKEYAELAEEVMNRVVR